MFCDKVPQFSVNDPCTSGILLSCSRELRQLTLTLEITVIRYFKKCYSPFLFIHLRMTMSLECLDKVFKCLLLKDVDQENPGFFQIWNHYDVYREGYLEKKHLRVCLLEHFLTIICLLCAK